MWNGVYQNIANTFNDSIRFLPFVEGIAEPSVNCNDVVYIPKYLLQEICAPWLGYYVFLLQTINPDLLNGCKQKAILTNNDSAYVS